MWTRWGGRNTMNEIVDQVKANFSSSRMHVYLRVLYKCNNLGHAQTALCCFQAQRLVRSSHGLWNYTMPSVPAWNITFATLQLARLLTDMTGNHARHVPLGTITQYCHSCKPAQIIMHFARSVMICHVDLG